MANVTGEVLVWMNANILSRWLMSSDDLKSGMTVDGSTAETLRSKAPMFGSQARTRT